MHDPFGILKKNFTDMFYIGMALQYIIKIQHDRSTLMLLHVKANKNDKAKPAVMLTNVLATSQVANLFQPATPGPCIRREAKERARPIAGMITTWY